MKIMQKFKSFLSKKKKEEFKGKEKTYRFTNIHNDKKGNRVGKCIECGKMVDVSDHSEEKCLENREKTLNEGHDFNIDAAPASSKEEAVKIINSWILNAQEEGGDLSKFNGVKWVGTVTEDRMEKLASENEDRSVVLGIVDGELTYAYSRRC